MLLYNFAFWKQDKHKSSELLQLYLWVDSVNHAKMEWYLAGGPEHPVSDQSSTSLRFRKEKYICRRKPFCSLLCSFSPTLLSPLGNLPPRRYPGPPDVSGVPLPGEGCQIACIKIKHSSPTSSWPTCSPGSQPPTAFMTRTRKEGEIQRKSTQRKGERLHVAKSICTPYTSHLLPWLYLSIPTGVDPFQISSSWRG